MVIHRILADSFLKFNGIPGFIFPQSENISATNGCMVTSFCMSDSNLPGSALKVPKLNSVIDFGYSLALAKLNKTPKISCYRWCTHFDRTNFYRDN